MPDHWDMPVGFDERDLFMVGVGGWTEAARPFMQTSPAASETPAYVADKGQCAGSAELISPPGCLSRSGGSSLLDGRHAIPPLRRFV